MFLVDLSKLWGYPEGPDDLQELGGCEMERNKQADKKETSGAFAGERTPTLRRGRTRSRGGCLE